MKSSCGHDHGADKLQALVCDLSQDLRLLSDGPVAIVALRKNEPPAVGTITNSANAAIMVHVICEQIVKMHPRGDCAACNDALDRMQRVIEILKNPMVC